MMIKITSHKSIKILFILIIAVTLPQYTSFAGGFLDTPERDPNEDEAFRFFTVEETGSLTLNNVVLSDNTTDGDGVSQGGAIYTNGELVIINSTIEGHSADEGGAIYVAEDGDATITNSFITGNRANEGGGIYSDGDLTITNSTIAGNSATEAGGGIVADSVEMQNSIVFGNDGSQIVAGESDITYSGIEDGWEGEGNISLDADATVFVDADNGDYHLDPASGLADQGNNDAIQGDTDIDGEARLFGTHVDLGADELQSSYPPPDRNLVYQSSTVIGS